MRYRSASPRHPYFDYRSVAAYFITPCAYDRRHLFGEVRDGVMYPNARGRILTEEWDRSQTLRDEIVLDAFVCMPNHVHGIVCIVPPGVEHVSPRGYRLGPAGRRLARDFIGPPRPPSLRAKSLSAMVAGWKSAATRRIRRELAEPELDVWQPSFWDQIIRSERHWRNCRRYIARNPMQWHLDRLNRNRPAR